MFTRRSVKVLSQVRSFATDAGEASSTPKMDTLLEKLASITNTKSSPSNGNQTMISQSKGKKKMYNGQKRNSKPYTKDNSFQSFKKTDSRNFNKEGNQKKRGTDSVSRTIQTVSHFDRFKNPKKTVTGNTESETKLNNIGLSFADLQEARALYIRSKLNPSKNINLNTNENSVYSFLHSRAVHKAESYDLDSNKFSKFKDIPNIYKSTQISKSELELSKDKLGYDAKSRILRALEQITTKRGFKLNDVEKKNVNYLPYNGLLYPYSNTTLPNNLARPKANLSNFSNIPEDEIATTIATVVRGERPELIFNSKETYKTEQLKVNAQVVVNGLNRNSQLQVDNLHISMSKVMLGKEPIKILPQPIIAPKKL
ncbi:hypothetical protein C6P40_001979 [Pichia californica]|uniref:Uncharacterized protein n=1 Tax=Pichia californica TaxID=460514 RepID=A0A9P6WKE1_9ASCO|nr:hypothetical protein C6P42_001291 [[Candida] californica]KAG0687712.1 hypothetical protein C6P40_001979 [[Candida] californica]